MDRAQYTLVQTELQKADDATGLAKPQDPGSIRLVLASYSQAGMALFDYLASMQEHWTA